MPLLSIITVNYNNASGLKKTIESVVDQSFSDLEYIIVDGGSTDNSIEVAKDYSRINKIISEPDKGVFDAQNKGINASTGKYLLFLNSGDILLNHSVLQQVVNLNLTSDIWYGELIFDFGNGNHKLMKLPNPLTKLHLYKDNIWHPATFINRALFSKYGLYNLDYKMAADYDFFFNTIAVKGVSSAPIPFPVTLFDTEGMSSLPENIDHINKERKAIHESYLSQDEINYLENLTKFKVKSLSKWLVGKPYATRFFNQLLSLYSKIRN